MSERKYTDEQIAKALECCSGIGDAKCVDCPYYDAERCAEASATDAIDLINRQKAEIEELEYDRKLIFDEGETWQKKANDLQVELDAMRGAANSYKMHYENARAEAIRKFAERLKDKARMPIGTLYGKMVYVEDIDNLVAEMTEGK